ncbi:MAG: gamma-glutamyltransferase, partial [Flavobacteriaceae bacterium]
MKTFFIAFLTLSILSCSPTKTGAVKGAVVSARIEASEVGRDIMKKGGNAYDAMVATSFALAV